ncbi:MAG TPA: hypothetical protein ENN55_00245 [Firmicutes bacterium]|nr:hypothetical protein [Bacillota bacterium]
MEIFYIIEILSLELEFNHKEKKLFSNMIASSFAGSLPGARERERFKKDFTAVFGAVKYRLFERWYDSKGIIQSKPEKNGW